MLVRETEISRIPREAMPVLQEFTYIWPGLKRRQWKAWKFTCSMQRTLCPPAGGMTNLPNDAFLDRLLAIRLDLMCVELDAAIRCCKLAQALADAGAGDRARQSIDTASGLYGLAVAARNRMVLTEGQESGVQDRCDRLQKLLYEFAESSPASGDSTKTEQLDKKVARQRPSHRRR